MAAYEFQDVQLDVAFTKASSKAELTNLDNISTIVGKIAKWYDLYAWSAWTAPTVEVTGSGNAITSASLSTSTGKLTLTKGETFLTSGTFIPLAGSNDISGNLKFNVMQKGVFLKDSEKNFAGIYYNGSNFWLGSEQAATAHFLGETFISAGYSSSARKGNFTIKVYAPNATNTGSTGYSVFHSGNLVAGTGLNIATAADTTYNGTKYTINHSNSVTAVTTAGLLKVAYDATGHITGSSAVAASDLPTHTHYEQDIKFDTSYSYKPRDDVRFPIVPQPLINTLRTNKFVFLPSSSITIEHSTDGGSTYTDSGYTDTGKCNLFTSRQIGNISIGPNTTAERTTSMRTMVTITRDSRYTRIDRFYIWFSTSGHNVYVDIQYATNAADTTWVDWRTNIQLLGWSGPNLINGPVLIFGASNTHVKKIRFIFRYAGIRADYKTSPSRIFEIAAYSDYAAWTATNNMMMNDHLYSWDKDQMAYFPAEIKVPTQLRVHNGNYGALFRNDGTSTYILLTNSGSALDGTWNSLRPFSIDNASGYVTMSEGLKVNTKDGVFLEIHGLTSSSYAYGSSSPKIRFTNLSRDQNAELIWDDHDTYCTPASLTLIGNQDGTYFIAPRIRLNSSSTTQALLDFKDENDKGAYLRYSTSTRGYGNIIAMLPYTVDGIGVVFNHTGGGYCCIGAGESPSNFTTAVMSTDKNPYGTTAWAYGSEQMCITADNSIYFVSGANGLNTTNHTDWTNLRTAIFDANGYFRPSVDNNGQIGASSYKWNAMYATTFVGNLTGNVTGNVTGQISVTTTNPTSATTYYGIFATAQSGINYMRANDGFRVMTLQGTTSNYGYDYLILGNSTASGTAGNKYGGIRFYGSDTTYIQLTNGYTGAPTSLRFSHSAGTTGADFSPNVTNKYDFGTSSLKWRNVYATTLNGTLNGDITAEVTESAPTTVDYEMLYPFVAKFDDAFPDDGQSIAKKPYFASNFAISRSTFTSNNETKRQTSIIVGDTGMCTQGGIMMYDGTDISTNYVAIYALNPYVESGYGPNLACLAFGGHVLSDEEVSSFIPSIDERYDLGHPDYKWGYVYAYNFVGALNGNASTASKLGTSTVGGTGRPIYLSSGTATACSIPSSGAWWNSSNVLVPQVSTSGVLEIGRYIDFHATAASTANYTYRLDNGSTTTLGLASSGDYNLINIVSSSYTQLRFQTTATNKAYISYGIVCWPLSTSGMTCCFQCGGNMVIGGGEFAQNAYIRKDSSNTNQVGYDDIVTTEREKLYLGADTEVQIISNAGNIATYNNNNHKVWYFKADGNLEIPGSITSIPAAESSGVSPFIIQNLKSTSNYLHTIRWFRGGSQMGSYGGAIGFHSTGGDQTTTSGDSRTDGAIIMVPYKTDTSPWNGTVGLYHGRYILKLDGRQVYHGWNSAGALCKTFNAINAVGWYRVMSLPAASPATSGKIISSLEITVFRNFNNKSPEAFAVRLVGLYGTTEKFNLLWSKQYDSTSQLFTQIRLVKSSDSKLLYVDLYYNSTTSNGFTVYCSMYKPNINHSDFTWMSGALVTDSLTAVAGPFTIRSNITYNNAWSKTDSAGTATSYWGPLFPDGTYNGWMRCPDSGIIPYKTGGFSDPHSALGTSSWAFNAAYIRTVYCRTNSIYNSANSYTYHSDIDSRATANRANYLPDASGEIMVRKRTISQQNQSENAILNGQQLLYQGTGTISLGEVDVDITGLFTNWSVIMFTIIAYGFGSSGASNKFSISGIVPLDLVKRYYDLYGSSSSSTLVVAGIQYNPSITAGNGYFYAQYVNDNKIRFLCTMNGKCTSVYVYGLY